MASTQDLKGPGSGSPQTVQLACGQHLQIQEDPKAKVWSGWAPDMLVKPKDDSDMFASRNWQDCLDAAEGKPKK